MSKKLLEINVSAEGAQGRIEIVGSISEWNSNNATDMRAKCSDLKNCGVTSAYVYLMTVGGDCFQANEIVNILRESFGSYNAIGGAIVASAGTYIAVCAETFEPAANGQFMIHKPMGGTYGNEGELENYLTLLRNMTATYYDAYAVKLKKPEQEFKDKWNGGDFWMTAKETVEWGFATGIKDTVVVDKQTQALLAAMGKTECTNIDKPQNMVLKLIASALGMPETASEAEVRAVVAANAKKASDYDALVAQNAEREKTEKAARIKACLDNAEKNKQIKADARANWQAQFEKDEAGTKALLDGIAAVAKPLSADITVSADGNGTTYQGKTFEQLQDEPEVLAELADNNPEAYASLFADWKKRNRIK